ncbi:MAG: methyltransferase domain-containing protein [Ktedonobacteraceae bacterium]|nr:methyltransferase domain-containing protein [Ktedonobacteraceae bacterium]
MSTEALLTAIRQKVPLSPSVQEAFRQIDRARFVPFHYRHDGPTWKRESAGDLVYQDLALTTQITNGLPSSSSSQPSIMAAMLEALDVRQGMRVLEMGTGTGYNVALLAHLVGESGHVTSIDIDSQLIARARESVKHVGLAQRATLLQADGCTGYAPAAPYDRVMLTAGFRQIEQIWLQQLADRGIFIGNLRGRIASVLLKLEKQGQEIAGQLLPQTAYFMEIHQEKSYPAMCAPDWQQYDLLPAQSMQAEQTLLQLLDRQAFLFFLETQEPQMEFHLRAFGTPGQHTICKVFLRDQSTATISPDGTVEARGDAWERIERAYQRYCEQGSPTFDEYDVQAFQNVVGEMRSCI